MATSRDRSLEQLLDNPRTCLYFASACAVGFAGITLLNRWVSVTSAVVSLTLITIFITRAIVDEFYRKNGA